MAKLSKDHQELYERSVKAARAAGERIMSYYGKDLEIYSKDIGTHTGDVVTQADHEAQDIIFDILNGALADDPILRDVAVLGEEMADHEVARRFDREFTFLVDPLDGTRGFLDHNNSFAVSIGFIKRDSTPVFGVALLPALGKLYGGIHQEAAWCNDTPLKAAPLEGELVVWVSEAEIFPPDRNAAFHAVCNAIMEQTPITKVRPEVIGSPVHKGCNLVGAQKPGLYLGIPRAQKGVSLWDMAAIASITTGAGGLVSDIYGDQLEINRKGSTYLHHNGFLFATHPRIAEVVVSAYGKHIG